MRIRHQKLNIDYDDYDPKKLENLNSQQAQAIADHMNYLAKELAETKFLLMCHEMDLDIPKIEDCYYEDA